MARFACLLVLSAAVSAQDGAALLRATGERLEDFEVVFDATKVDRSSAEALAESFARLQREQHAVNARYVRLFRQAHLEVLRTYYAPGLADKQEASYRATASRDDDMRCVVTSVSANEEGFAQAALEVTTRSRQSGKPETRRSLLHLQRVGDRWRLTSIHDQGPDQEWKERPLGVPPVMQAREVSRPASSRKGPAETVQGLRDAIGHLGALGHNGRVALQRHFFEILAAFYGAEFAEQAGRARPALPVLPATRTEVGEPVQRPGDVTRIPVTVTEAVPGTEQRSALAESAFDLKREGELWRVVGELTRPHPNQPLQPAAENFALLFLFNG